MKRRYYRPSSNLKRLVGQYEVRIVIWIVCEGKNTEPSYMTAFARDHGNGRVKIEKVPEAGVPLTLVKTAVQLHEELTKKASKKTANSFDKAFKVWAIFDRDDHDHIMEAIQLAEKKGVPFCMSNPCFELWGVLHITDQDAEIHRHALQHKLKKIMPGYDHNKGAEFNYSFIKDNYEEAKKRAILINRRREEEGIPRGNTSTEIYMLLDEIIENGRK